MRTAEEIAKDIVLGIDTYDDQCVVRIAKIIRAARIEAVEEFRKLALTECYDTRDEYAANRIWHRIAALPALPEEP